MRRLVLLLGLAAALVALGVWWPEERPAAGSSPGEPPVERGIADLESAALDPAQRSAAAPGRTTASAVPGASGRLPAEDAQGGALAAQVPTDRKLALRGRVVLLETEEPVAGLRLRVRQERLAPGEVRRHRGHVVTVTTDEQGRFLTAQGFRPGGLSVSPLQDDGRGELRTPLQLSVVRMTPGWSAAEHGADLCGGVRLRPSRVTLTSPADAADVQESRFTLSLPVSRLHARVLDELGTALPDATVELRFDDGRRTSRTDADGRTCLGLRQAEVGRPAELRARAGDRVSPPQELVTSLDDAEWTLQLLPAIRLIVSVEGEEHLRLYDLPFALRAAAGSGEPIPLDGWRVESSAVHVGALLPGEYTLFSRPTVGVPVALATVELRAGEQRRVTLRLPEDRALLAAAGRVVDEAGQPLAGEWVRVQAEFSAVEVVETLADGSFEALLPRSAEVLVRAGPDVDHALFEEPLRRVPFGTRDIVFRRVREKAIRHGRLLVVDGVTGDAIDGARLIYGSVSSDAAEHLHRGDGSDVMAYWIGANGSNLYLPERADLWLAVEADGYRKWTGGLEDVLPRGQDPERFLRLELYPGLLRTPLVLDERSGSPIAGARFLAGGQVLATTDGAGRARIEEPAWPAGRELLVEADGYETKSWPLAEWGALADVLLLARRRD